MENHKEQINSILKAARRASDNSKTSFVVKYPLNKKLNGFRLINEIEKLTNNSVKALSIPMDGKINFIIKGELI
jgi:hypothetical protein